MKASFKSIVGTFALALLSACGGGGTPAPASNTVQSPLGQATPVANAGVDQNVFVNATVTVDGGASSDANGDALNYKWVLSSRPAGSHAVLSAPAIIRPTFVADVAGVYSVALIVNDGTSDSAPDSVSITASEKPVALNALPTANAGPNQIVSIGSTVILTGADSAAVNHEPLTYQWSMVSRPSESMATFTDPKIVAPRFVADKAGTYSIVLRVSDGKGDSLPSTVVINAVASPTSTNIAPVANAGSDQSVTVKSAVTLDGTLSRDANGDSLTYSWNISSKPLGSYAAVAGATTSKPQFVADVVGSYEVSLSVSDGKVTSPVVDKITIVAKDQSVASIPDTGIYRCATLSSESAAYLYSIGHTYLDRDHDGRPCEANDLLNEATNSYISLPPSNAGQCYVHGYYRKNGTYVSGYWRRCPS